MTELHIDPAIRIWVFLPIVLITFLIGIVRHYLYILFAKDKQPDLIQIEEYQAIIRARLLRENGKYLPEKSFAMRKQFFSDENTGYFKTNQRPVTPPNLTTTLQDMLKGNLLNVLPMLVIGGWINLMFSGFVTTRVPFPLTLRFKPMLQSCIDMDSLDADWVSSASWYIIDIFGLRPIYNLMLGEDNVADGPPGQTDYMTVVSLTMSADPQTIFKSEFEALAVCEYQNALEKSADEIAELALEKSA